ncbi:MAG: DUF4870 domain-containing protein [Bacteroidales bacterium]|nr:DUF4870 domain-containing protein [Bacteroidales bacterium]
MDQNTQQIQDERMWGMFAHLSALAGYIIPLGSIIGPLVIWSIKKQEYPFVDDQGKEALNFNISMAIYMIVSAILIIVVIGIILLIAIGLFQLIMIIIAAVKANNGESFRYPLTIRFVN